VGLEYREPKNLPLIDCIVAAIRSCAISDLYDRKGKRESAQAVKTTPHIN